MSHEELQDYLQAQLAEIRRYQNEQSSSGVRQIDIRGALEEWIDQNAASFQEAWLRERLDGLSARS